MSQNIQPRRADRDLIWEVAQHDRVPQSAIVRQMVDAWLTQQPAWRLRAEELRQLFDRDPASTHFGREPASR